MEISQLKRQFAKLQSHIAKQKNKQTGQSVLLSTNAFLELKQQVTELQTQMTKLRVQNNLEQKSN